MQIKASLRLSLQDKFLTIEIVTVILRLLRLWLLIKCLIMCRYSQLQALYLKQVYEFAMIHVRIFHHVFSLT